MTRRSEATSQVPARSRVDLHLHLPTHTIIRVILTLLVVFITLRLWPQLVVLSLSLLLAVALHPLVVWFEQRGRSRAMIVTMLAIVMVGLGSLLVTLISASMGEQLSQLVSHYSSFCARAMARVPANYPMLKRALSEIFALPYSAEISAHLRQPLALGRSALSAGMATFFAIIFTLYLLLDGRRLYAWLLAYVPRKHRDRVALTIEEVSVVVYAYVRGQLITSLMFTLFAALVLSLLDVPAALPLALLAGVFDIIPVIGIIFAVLPALLLALTVSGTAALVVMGSYVGYHALETYLIVPWVYGRHMRLSTLAVLLALVIGNELQGLIGAVLILPVVAAYPIIERIWLARYLHDAVIQDHDALSKLEPNEDGEQVVETVLHGEKHAWESDGQPRPQDDQRESHG